MSDKLRIDCLTRSTDGKNLHLLKIFRCIFLLSSNRLKDSDDPIDKATARTLDDLYKLFDTIN